ncbi:uncharacterized protein LOC103992559 isoform X2 [Musa acuminata AAA Group]|uniref:uncharacterized protein LOC103992559 isoform X2 n=1 Tax=Musa acuminata AAA Group TaxID=214697 RepID=UPI0031CF87B1
MEVSVRFFGSTAALHRQFRLITVPSFPLPLPNSRFPPVGSSGCGSPTPFVFHPCSRLARRSAAGLCSSPPRLASSSLSLPPLLSLSHLFASMSPQEGALASDSGLKEGFVNWGRDRDVLEGGDLGLYNEKGAIWRVVMLGWLGAEPKHLNKYAGLYTSKGIEPVKFVIPVKELLGFDLGRRVQDKIARFTTELVSWCSQTEEDGRERCLLFHTFSNTGWLTYGSILENLQTRPDIIEKIKGCVIDSGADPEISPQVWAAGFSAALLKKRSSLISSSDENNGVAKPDMKMNGTGTKDNSSSFAEILTLSLLEKFFTLVLMLPDVNQRLRKTISILWNKQPLCPQLYLYSSADMVIPVNSVENFIKEQKTSGRIVHAHDFGSSPHVDHLRSYPQMYSAKITEFMEECCTCFWQDTRLERTLQERNCTCFAGGHGQTGN